MPVILTHAASRSSTIERPIFSARFERGSGDANKQEFAHLEQNVIENLWLFERCRLAELPREAIVPWSFAADPHAFRSGLFDSTATAAQGRRDQHRHAEAGRCG